PALPRFAGEGVWLASNQLGALPPPRARALLLPLRSGGRLGGGHGIAERFQQPVPPPQPSPASQGRGFGALLLPLRSGGRLGGGRGFAETLPATCAPSPTLPRFAGEGGCGDYFFIL